MRLLLKLVLVLLLFLGYGIAGKFDREVSLASLDSIPHKSLKDIPRD